MEMRNVALARIRELDARRDAEMFKFLQLGVAYGGPPPLFLHKEYADQLPEMAKKFGVTFEEFLNYVKVQAYINASAQGDCTRLLSPRDMAEKLGIPFEEFNDYLHEQISLIHDALADEEDEMFVLPSIPESWELERRAK